MGLLRTRNHRNLSKWVLMCGRMLHALGMLCISRLVSVQRLADGRGHGTASTCSTTFAGSGSELPPRVCPALLFPAPSARVRLAPERRLHLPPGAPPQGPPPDRREQEHQRATSAPFEAVRERLAARR